MELRRRRGLMIALVLVNIGLPTVYLVIRLLLSYPHLLQVNSPSVVAPSSPVDADDVPRCRAETA